MTISTTYRVRIGTVPDPSDVGPTDFTSRTMGFRSELSAPVGRFGRGELVLDLDNTDGALTPGSDGTYSSVDWLSQGVFIDATVGTHTRYVFDGIITEFDIVDDGVTSFVRIRADDGLTIGGAARTTIDLDITATVTYGSVTTLLDDLFNGDTTTGWAVTETTLPSLGNGTTASIINYEIWEFVGIDNVISITRPPASGSATFDGPVMDFVQDKVMPAGPLVAWPSRITTDTIFSTGDTQYLYQTLRPTHHRGTRTLGGVTFDNRFDFTFDETPAAGELPFRELDRGYTTDMLINEATVSAVFTEPRYGAQGTFTEKDTDSQTLYGQRAATYEDVLHGLVNADGTWQLIGSAGRAQQTALPSIAERHANVFAQPSFAVRSLEVTEKMCDAYVGSSSTSEEAWSVLLDVTLGMWQVCTVNYTPAGSSTQITEHALIVGKQVEATPTDTRVRLEFLPIDAYAGLLLDDTILGVLDTMRLG